jgi:hypothetical protein
VDPLIKAAENKCHSFEGIHETLNESNVFLDESIKISFRINPLLEKPEAAEISLDGFRMNISANVSEHPVSGECINPEPFEVISWQTNTFSLEEGCETPPDSGIKRKTFERPEDSIEYFFSQISKVQSRL